MEAEKSNGEARNLGQRARNKYRDKGVKKSKGDMIEKKGRQSLGRGRSGFVL